MRIKLSFFISVKLLIISVLSFGQAQNSILKGIVVDAETKQALPFVNITINEGLSGTTSDLDGRFSFTPKGEVRKISFSYVGYGTFVYVVNSPDDLKPFEREQVIKLFSQARQLKEVVINAGENPAHRLISLAVQNRNRNNPEKIASFSYESYNKFYMTAEAKPPKPDSIVATSKDSASLQIEQLLAKQHLFLTESVTERKFIAPSFNKETVLANRVSGFRNPSFASVATDFQPFSFYQDFITILNKNYLNPISKGATEKYLFTMIDTVLALPDTVYIIAFKPFEDKNFDGLEGTMYLNTKQYAIEAITANSQAERDDFISFKIKQKYEWVADAYWFPTQLHTDFTFHKIKINEDQKCLGIARCYLQNIQIKPPLRRRDFSEVTQEIDAEANKKTEEYWQNYRGEILQNKEINTYQYLDSLGQRHKFDRLVQLGEILSTKRLGIRKLDLDFDNLLRYNRYEGLRLGLGVYTNNHLNRHFSLGGYVAYGTKDGNFKYGISGLFNVWQRFDLKLGGQYYSDVKEPGMSGFLGEKTIFGAQDVRNILTERMDKIRNGEVFALFRPIRNTQLRLGLNTRWLRPAYNYQLDVSMVENEPILADNFRLSEFTAQFNYAFGQEFLKFGNRKIFIQAKYPVIGINYTHAGTFLRGEFEYNKWEANIQYSHIFRNVGTTAIELFGGVVNGNAPYSVLFNGRGTTRQLPVVVNHYFQTMEMYEFISDRYLNVFLTHNFGKLLFRPSVKWFQPELMLSQAMAWGTLQNSGRHLNLGFTTMEKGYFESGVLINNLLRFNYLDIAYFGIGVGVYFRYGSYARDKFSENTAFKMTTSFSF